MISSSCCHQDEIIGETWSMAWNEYLSSLGMRWRSWSLGTNLTSTAGRCHEFAAFLFHFCITCAPNLFSEGDCFILADFVRHSPRNVGCLVQQFSQKTLVYCILPLNRGVFSFSSHHFLPTVWIKTYLKFPKILGASSFSPHFPIIFPSVCPKKWVKSSGKVTSEEAQELAQELEATAHWNHEKPMEKMVKPWEKNLGEWLRTRFSGFSASKMGDEHEWKQCKPLKLEFWTFKQDESPPARIEFLYPQEWGFFNDVGLEGTRMRNLSNRIGEKADGQNILPREPSPLQVVSHLIQLFFSSQQKLLGTAPFFLVGSISELPFFVGTAQKLRGEIPWWLFQALWIETSAKSNENVEEAFTQLAKKISQHHSSWAKLGGLGVQNDLTIWVMKKSLVE